MGTSIAYRGRLAEPARIEDFEDRLLDFALEMGGLVEIWRSHDRDRPERMVRGIILSLSPGQESTSLLVAPEGYLIGQLDIKNAEQGKLTEPPWCVTKTQFGSLEGHVALVEMFRALKREFMPNLEVADEGGYWEKSDLAELKRRREVVEPAIEAMAQGFEQHDLRREASEGPDILLKRIERIVALVQRILGRPAEHPPVTFSDEDDEFNPPDPDKVEAEWDEMFKHNRRQQERMNRSMEERRGAGEDDEAAFAGALDDLALEIPGENDQEDELDEPWLDDDDDDDDDDDENAVADDEDDPFAESDESEAEDEDAVFDKPERRKRHPLLQGATDLMLGLHDVFPDGSSCFEAAIRTLFQGVGDAVGGLAQALPKHREDDDAEDDFDEYGLRVVQFKRALRGTAFARGALFMLRPAMTAEQFEESFNGLDKLENEIHQELSQLRSEYRTDDS